MVEHNMYIYIYMIIVLFVPIYFLKQSNITIYKLCGFPTTSNSNKTHEKE